jgi:hypothetical protein
LGGEEAGGLAATGFGGGEGADGGEPGGGFVEAAGVDLEGEVDFAAPGGPATAEGLFEGVAFLGGSAGADDFGIEALDGGDDPAGLEGFDFEGGGGGDFGDGVEGIAGSAEVVVEGVDEAEAVLLVAHGSGEEGTLAVEGEADAIEAGTAGLMVEGLEFGGGGLGEFGLEAGRKAEGGQGCKKQQAGSGDQPLTTR